MRRGVYVRDSLSRRRFLELSALSLLSGVVVTVTGCGKQSASATQTGPGMEGIVSDNHGHVGFVADAQIAGSRSITISIRGAADHDHRVILTPSELAAIGRGLRLAKGTSMNAGHYHTITFN